jgi:heme/copper-type cytochrome/quinol oxidase subunit 3
MSGHPSISSSVSAAVTPVPALFGAAGGGKIGMWVFLVSDGMGFGGMLAVYGVLRARAAEWPDAGQRLSIPLAAGMTLALLTSSLGVLLALAAARARRRAAATGWLGVTVGGGLLFLGGQALEYRHLLTGAPAMGLTSDTFASVFYTVTAYHGLHVLAGVIYLGVLLVRNAGAAPSAEAPAPGDARAGANPIANGLEIAALFWHFVDLAWVPIFTFVYLLPVR